MKNLSKVLLAIFLLLSPVLLRADELAEVARVSWSKNVKTLDKKIKALGKRIDEGVRTGTLTTDKAAELRAEVQALWDKKKEYQDANGAKVLTDDQLDNLKQMWKETAKKIHEAKHPKVPSTGSSEAK